MYRFYLTDWPEPKGTEYLFWLDNHPEVGLRIADTREQAEAICADLSRPFEVELIRLGTFTCTRFKVEELSRGFVAYCEVPGAIKASNFDS